MSSNEGTLSAGHVGLDRPRSRERGRSWVSSLTWPRPELLVLLVLAGVLNLWALTKNGWANEYYSAAVRSMSSSWHNFLFGSFDASGVMTVDKPPLALWVQTLSVKLFGFHSLSILVPQALMGVASVALVYDLVRRRFGRLGGFVAGLVLATTPIAVAISRHNNPDALLTLCCVAAVWFTVRALETGRTRWLVWAGVMVGLGFETKMAVALMVAPGIAAAWAWARPRGARFLRPALGSAGAAIAVGGAWPLLVALTPASDRPWISGTADNSIWSLIWGYNGLGRIDGQAGGPGGAGPGGGGGGGGTFFGEAPGPFRLLNSALGGQAGWLLGFALVGGIAIALASRLRRDDARTGWLLAVGGGFATTGIAFSAAKGIFHPYYVSLMAPFTAGLVGAGAAQLARGGTQMRILAAVAVAAGVATELAVLHNSPGSLTWLPPVLVVLGLGAIAALAVANVARIRVAILAAALGLLLIAPASWAVQTVGHQTSGTFPAGGPASVGMGGGGPGGGGGFAGPRGGTAPPNGGGFGGLPGGGTMPVRPGGTGTQAGGGGGMFVGNSAALDRRPELRQGERRRNRRGLQPAGRLQLDHQLGRERGRPRRLLRARERGEHLLARAGGALRAGPLRARRFERRRDAQRLADRLAERDGRGRAGRHEGDALELERRHAVRPLRPRRRSRRTGGVDEDLGGTAGAPASGAPAVLLPGLRPAVCAARLGAPCGPSLLRRGGSLRRGARRGGRAVARGLGIRVRRAGRVRGGRPGV